MAREAERTAVAREIHDEVGQILTLVRFDLQRLRGALEKEAPKHAGAAAETLELVDGTIDELRDLCARLRPPILDHVGLGAALEWQAQQFTTRTELPCRLLCDGEGAGLDDSARTALFRIFQETLTNAARHSGAGEVQARFSDSPSGVRLEVSDNGCGFDPSKVTGSGALGLAGIRERALALGGEAQILSETGSGTRVIVDIPYQAGPNQSTGAEA
jgi:signal transduction histidine kinase